MATEANKSPEAVDDQLQLLYKCFLGRFLEVSAIRQVQNRYDIWWSGNDIARGLRVIIKDRVYVMFF